jgi:hypothetical protein
MKMLKLCLNTPPKKLAKLLKLDSHQNRYFFADNGSNILAVAHLDTVCEPSWVFIADHPQYGEILFSPTLDDRLGVYIIAEMLKHYGIVPDILFTQDEEKGNSSAQHFTTTKKYHWLVEFDRAGGDVVTYDYAGTEWEQALKEFFPKVNRGSYSDICELEHLGCKAVNIGIGYENNHSEMAYARLVTMQTQVKNFVRFYRKFKDVHFLHEESFAAKWENTWDSAYSHYNYGSGWMDCPECGCITEIPYSENDLLYAYQGIVRCDTCDCIITEHVKMRFHKRLRS